MERSCASLMPTRIVSPVTGEVAQPDRLASAAALALVPASQSRSRRRSRPLPSRSASPAAPPAGPPPDPPAPIPHPLPPPLPPSPFLRFSPIVAMPRPWTWSRGCGDADGLHPPESNQEVLHGHRQGSLHSPRHIRRRTQRQERILRRRAEGAALDAEGDGRRW